MLVRKFEAGNMAAALKQVKDTLGSDALILSTRTLGRKGLGVLGKQTIEVTAAIESPAMKTNMRRAVPSPKPRTVALGRVATTYGQRVETLEDEQVALSQAARRESRKVEVVSNPLEDEVRELRSQLEAQNVSRLQDEINQLKELVQQFAGAQRPQPEVIEAAVPAAPVFEPAAGFSPLTQVPTQVSRLKSNNEKSLDQLIDILTERGIDEDAAATIARFAAPR